MTWIIAHLVLKLLKPTWLSYINDISTYKGLKAVKGRRKLWFCPAKHRTKGSWKMRKRWLEVQLVIPDMSASKGLKMHKSQLWFSPESYCAKALLGVWVAYMSKLEMPSSIMHTSVKIRRQPVDDSDTIVVGVTAHSCHSQQDPCDNLSHSYGQTFVNHSSQSITVLNTVSISYS